MFATIELQKQAAADRYYHQLHPKPWGKSPEEAAWALMQRIMGLGQWDGSSSPVQALSTKLPRDLPPVSPLGMDSGQYPNGVKGLDHVKGLDQWHGLMASYILRPPLEGRALHSQECFLPPRGGFNLRCTRERYNLRFETPACPQ